MRPPLIGLPTGTTRPRQGKSAEFALPPGYSRAIAAAGGLAVMLPPLDDPDHALALYERLDGVLLCGGGDVAPEHYGLTRVPSMFSIDPPRDALELALARRALSDGKPILGICRGAQLLNVAAGGALVRDISSECPGSLNHVRPSERPPDQLVHPVSIEGASLLCRALGLPGGPARVELRVNTSHHQAVSDVASGFRAAAWAPDGIIEAIEHLQPDAGWALGVQWHPEHLVGHQAEACALFRSFVDACRLWREGQ